MPRPTKVQLADLAIKLFNNIDHGDQFANGGTQDEMFYHCDKQFLLKLIENFMECVEDNKKYAQHNILSDEDELEEMLSEARKVLGLDDPED